MGELSLFFAFSGEAIFTMAFRQNWSLHITFDMSVF